MVDGDDACACGVCEGFEDASDGVCEVVVVAAFEAEHGDDFAEAVDGGDVGFPFEHLVDEVEECVHPR